jgi:hypothetical protein
VESSVETGHRWHPWKGRIGGFDTRYRLRLVEGSELRQGPQAPFDRRPEPHRSGELGTSVNDPMPDRVDRAQTADLLLHSGDGGRFIECR